MHACMQLPAEVLSHIVELAASSGCGVWRVPDYGSRSYPDFRVETLRSVCKAWSQQILGQPRLVACMLAKYSEQYQGRWAGPRSFMHRLGFAEPSYYGAAWALQQAVRWGCRQGARQNTLVADVSGWPPCLGVPPGLPESSFLGLHVSCVLPWVSPRRDMWGKWSPMPSTGPSREGS